MAILSSDEDLAGLIAGWVAKGKYGKLLEFWAKGVSFDWSSLYGERKPRRISLPTYPFLKERYWLPNFLDVSRSAEQPATAAASEQVRGEFDKQFFGELFKAVDNGLLSVESALAEAHNRV